MAKAQEKTVVLHEEQPLTIDSSGAVQTEEEPDEIALDRLLSELEPGAAGIKVSIWKVDENISGRGAGKDVFLAKMSPSDFEDYGFAGIQQDWGEGKYRVRIFDQKGMLSNRIYVVGPPSKVLEVIKEKPNGAAAPPSDFTQGLSALAQAMQNGFTSLAQIMLQQGNNRKTMLEELTLYKSLFAPANGGNNGTDPLAAISTAVSLIKDLGGGGKETSTADIFLKLAEEFAPAITEIAKNQSMKAQPAPQAPPQPQPAPLPGPVSGLPLPAPKPSPEPAMLDPVALALKAYLPMIVQQAQAGNDPEKYADMILDNVPIDAAEKLANRPDWLEYLNSINPGVAANAQWFATLRTHLLRFIAEEKQQDLTSAQNSGFNTLGTGADD